MWRQQKPCQKTAHWNAHSLALHAEWVNQRGEPAAIGRDHDTEVVKRSPCLVGLKCSPILFAARPPATMRVSSTEAVADLQDFEFVGMNSVHLFEMAIGEILHDLG